MAGERDTQEGLVRPAIAEMKDVSKIFSSGDGIHDLSLTIPSGSIFGFIGPSGSGKTTTVRLLTSILEPGAGNVRVMGEEPSQFTEATRSRIGYMPQRSVLYPNLSVWENLRFFASLYGIGRDRRPLDKVLELVELNGHERKRVSQISGGMRRRLSLAAALVHNPDVIFLDEPTAGIDPVLRRKMWDHFESLRSDGRTLFVTTQYVGEAAYCDLVGVLSDGRLLLVDTPIGLRHAAFGGDVIHIDFPASPSHAVVESIATAVGATQSEFVSGRRVKLVVEEASEALPLLGAFLSEEGIDVEAYEEFLPPFDDVFVELIERHRSGDSADEQAGELVRV